MPDIATIKENNQTYLNRLRRYARARGFRILRDWTGSYSLVDARIAPQRALDGLVHVPLATIGIALTTPLPTPKPKRVGPMAPPMTHSEVAEVTDAVIRARRGNGSAL